MNESRFSPPNSDSSVDPAYLLVQHLSQQPQDLIDARRLMRRFQASPADFQQALNQLEQLLSEEDTSSC